MLNRFLADDDSVSFSINQLNIKNSYRILFKSLNFKTMVMISVLAGIDVRNHHSAKQYQ